MLKLNKCLFIVRPDYRAGFCQVAKELNFDLMHFKGVVGRWIFFLIFFTSCLTPIFNLSVMTDPSTLGVVGRKVGSSSDIFGGIGVVGRSFSAGEPVLTETEL